MIAFANPLPRPAISWGTAETKTTIQYSPPPAWTQWNIWLDFEPLKSFSPKVKPAVLGHTLWYPVEDRATREGPRRTIRKSRRVHRAMTRSHRSARSPGRRPIRSRGWARNAIAQPKGRA